MPPLYQDACFTFRFAADRIIPSFHVEGIEARRWVSVYKIDPDTGTWLELLTRTMVRDGGWVDLPEPIHVRAGEAYLVTPVTSLLKRRSVRILLIAATVLFAGIGYFYGLFKGGGNPLILAVAFGVLPIACYPPITFGIAGVVMIVGSWRGTKKR